MHEPVLLRVRRIRPERDGDIPLPRPMSAGAAGLDVCAAVDHPLIIPPGQRAAVPTGLQMAVPQGFEIQVRPRSGLAWKHGLTVANAPGTVDADYRGEVMILLVNLSDRPFAVERGMRVAQLVVGAVPPVAVQEVSDLDGTERGDGGFGSTGTRRADGAEE